MAEFVDRHHVGITISLGQDRELVKTLIIPGRGPIVGPARPKKLCDEGHEVYDDLEKRYCHQAPGTIIFDGTQYDWEEGINRLLASRGQRINWDR